MGSWVLEDLRSKNGTRLDGAPVERAALSDGALIECGHSFLVFRSVPDVPRDAVIEEGPDRVGALATFHVPFGRELARLAAVAPTDVPVLLCGETGTGTEVAARAVHERSGRAGAFVAVNCGALPASLVEAELFGSRKGAYTGADAEREGLVRAARAGTLFLDEVGDLPLPAQPALLRVLQEREVVPVGATRAERVDFRLVSATHRDLAALGAEERFRADLHARLAGFTLSLPPLRARAEDLGLLVAELLGRAGAPSPVRLEHEAARALLRHAWPLNVRELDRALAAALALAGGEPIGLEHLPAELGAAR
ncbi:MAG: sigma 54-interacting transcriptional regulator, partial [Polyangiaceae bacterium]|nr:sigma 54-interacting transcriptional regulator [Polyangiaceae bacterium]